MTCVWSHFVIVRSFVLIISRNSGTEPSVSKGIKSHLRAIPPANLLSSRLYTLRPPVSSALAAKSLSRVQRDLVMAKMGWMEGIDLGSMWSVLSFHRGVYKCLGTGVFSRCQKKCRSTCTNLSRLFRLDNFYLIFFFNLLSIHDGFVSAGNRNLLSRLWKAANCTTCQYCRRCVL